MERTETPSCGWGGPWGSRGASRGEDSDAMFEGPLYGPGKGEDMA